MELRQLNYFIAVVEEGTISGAARRLNMSQPPLTAQMHALESELGCALFEHAGRRLRITEAGRTFYARAKAIATLCASARSEMADLSAGAAGVLHMGVISSVCGAEFIGWLSEFAYSHPGVRYDLHEANTYQLINLLRERAIDVAIVRTPFAAPDMRISPIRRESMVAAGEARYFTGMPAGAAIALSDIGGTPLLIYRRWETILRERFERMGVAPCVKCVSDSAITTMALAAAGMGVALVPASTLAGADFSGLEQREIAGLGVSSEIAAVYRSEAELTAAAREFLAELPHCGDD
ncbi:MAG: LysR family transcriptional regulator [Clostridiales bacterium]|nr:LysR family transcriptional regulator [Clostridiales bacterium]MDY4200764.1 LysR family transcriptional regulator [Candidatus Fimadaptatus sp.]